MIVNRRVWMVDQYDGIPFTAGPFVVTAFKQFLPAGPTKNGKAERKQSLVQFYSDVGLRTVAVASLWGRDPNRNASPW